MTLYGPIQQEGAVAAGNLLAMARNNVAKDSGISAAGLPALPLTIDKGGTGATDAAGARTNLGLADSSTIPIGTSGHKIPVLDGGPNLWNASQGFLGGWYVDTGFFADISTGQPRIGFDNAGSSFLGFDRGNKTWRINVNNADMVHVDPTGTTVFGKLMAGDTDFSLLIGGGGNYPTINFDASDYLRYERGSNIFRLVIGEHSTFESSLDHFQVYGPNGNQDDPNAFRVSGQSGLLVMGVYAGAATIRGMATDFSAPQLIQMEGSAVVLNARSNRLVFKQGDVERGMINTIGFTKLSNADGFWMDPYAGNFHEINSSHNTAFVLWVSSFATGDPIGIRVHYQNASPNGPGNYFMYNEDSTQVRSALFGNGGLGNFPGNNVNFASDATLKTDITRYSDAELDGLEAAFCAVDWGKWKYLDQTHSDWNHGYTAQGVAAAFASAAPELVDDLDLGAPSAKSDEPYKPLMRKAIYYHDLENIGMALLARALKRIDELESTVAQLQAR